jgi:hypothetical protein
MNRANATGDIQQATGRENETIKAIEALWQEHQAARFPARCRGADVNGIDLVLLDADIAIRVETFLREGCLDLFDTAVLGVCYGDTWKVRRILYAEAAEYFGRLGELAELVLREIARQAVSCR